MNGLDYAAPFIGAVVLEVVRWYQIREKLHLARYKRLLKSVGYWLITGAMVIVGGVGSLILADGKFGAAKLLVLGAAFPTLFKEIVGAAQSPVETELGTDKEPQPSVWRDYFSPGS